MIATYLLLVEIAKRRFYAIQAHPRRLRPTQQERHQRRIQRRAARFTHHATHLHRVDDIDWGPARRTRIGSATAEEQDGAVGS
jgi:hypothetical protein